MKKTLYILLATVLFLGPVVASQAATECVDITQGMVGWWPGDENASDLLNRNHGLLTNGVSTVEGKVGRAFKFDGKNGYVEINPSPRWSFGWDNFSISMWVNFSSRSRSMLIGCDEGIWLKNKWVIEYENSELHFHYVNMERTARENVAYPVRYPFIPQLNRWYHLVITRSGPTFRMYLDGEVVAVGNNSNRMPDVVAPLTIGWAEHTFFFNGLIDEVAIHRRALTAVEVDQLWNANQAGICKNTRIIMPPLDQEAKLGADISFNIETVSTTPVTYRWQHNGTDIEGATGAILGLQQIKAEDLGTYSVIVKNSEGFNAEASARLSLPLFDLQTFAGLVFNSAPGTKFRIEYRTDMRSDTPWNALTNLTLPTQPYLFIDPEAIQRQDRFYRAIKIE